jgi:hypothetical protein
VFSSYEDWIYLRNQLYKSKVLDENTYFQELYFYKCYKANDWIEDNCKTYEQFYVNKYPQSIRIRNLLIPLDFDIHMFTQFKENHHFSIFYDTKKDEAPYIPDHYLLTYSTICEEPKVEYSYEELLRVTEDLNHGGMDEDGHFFLLSTSLYTHSLHKALDSLFTNLKFILQYGEFSSLVLNTDFRRSGAAYTFQRSYNYTQDYNADEYVLIDSDISEYKLNQANDDLTLAYLNDTIGVENNETTITDLSTSNFENETELKSKMFDILMLTIKNSSKEAWNRQMKSALNTEIKNFKSNHINKFNKNKVLDITISNVIDLTNDNEEENTTNNL